jgi:Beta-ketoacyl synthase, N-terminal domain
LHVTDLVVTILQPLDLLDCRFDQHTFNTMEPIAIIGLSFKLPQNAEDESSFWDILEKGRNVMTEWPESRVNVDAFYNSDSTKDNIVRFVLNQ